MINFLLRLLCFPFFLNLSAFAFSQSESNAPYILDTGDTVSIVVFEEPDMSFDIKIDESGVFAYPYLDNVRFAGKTTEQLESFIAEGLRGRVLINPNVSISISAYRPFSIGGEVTSPGSYPYEPGLNIKKAINLAGGATEWASGTRFTLDREHIDDSNDSRPSLETLISPGDVVTVLPRRF